MIEIKEIKRTDKEVAELLEKYDHERAVLVELKTELEPDEFQWSNLDYLQHEYYYDNRKGL